MIALLLRVYSGRSAAEIIATEPKFIEAIGLAKHLSPTRSNGLAAMLAAIKQHAREALGMREASQAPLPLAGEGWGEGKLGKTALIRLRHLHPQAGQTAE